MSLNASHRLTIATSVLMTAAAIGSGPVPPDESMISTAPAFTNWWGGAVAFGDNFIVVGANSDDTIALNAGSISVIFFDPATGVVTATVIEAPATLSASAAFGNAVAVWDNKIAVAAPAQHNGGGSPVGAVYIYEAGSSFITLEEVLQPSVLSIPDLFGYDVDIQDNRVVVGAPGPGGGNGSGCVWVFDNTGGDDWSMGEQLFLSGGDEGDALGWSVAINQDNKDEFAASAILADVTAPGDEAGRIVIFEYSAGPATWAPVAFLDQTMLPMGDTTIHLGNDIDFDGTTVIAGEMEYDTGIGRAHTFVDSFLGWQHGQWLDRAGSATVLSLGSAVALRDDFAAVGAKHADFGSPLEGAAYLYHADGAGNWNQIAELQSNGGTAGALGNSVSLGTNGLIVGAPGVTEAAAAPIIGHGNVQYWSTAHTPGCPSDVNMDGVADADDIADLLAAWGPCGDPDGCVQDANDDGDINMLDLLELLTNWGSCI